MTPEEALKYIEKWYQPTTEPEEREKAIKALSVIIKSINEIQKYREIGTVEECWEAVEKQKPQIPEFQHMLSDYVAKFKCPGCGHYFNYNCTDDEIFYCNDCGQALRMENEDD